MSHPVLVVCESPTDFRRITRLMDRFVLASAPQWVHDAGLDAAREYIGLDGTEPFLRWQHVDRATAELSPPSNRRFSITRRSFPAGFPEHEDAKQFGVFMNVLRANVSIRQPDAVVLVRDADNDSERRHALLALNGRFRDALGFVVAGVPQPETEAWLLTGFLHDITDQETNELDFYTVFKLRGVDPCRASHQLNAPNKTDDRHPKQALNVLCGSDDRKDQCLEAPFPLLRLHGQHNGLADFLNELETRFIPLLFGGPAPSPR